MKKFATHKRREWTSPGFDPYAMTNHRLRLGKLELSITDGPALVADVYVGRFKMFISESINRWAFPLVKRLYDYLEDAHFAKLENNDEDYDRGFYGGR